MLQDEKIRRAIEKAKTAHPQLSPYLEAQAELLAAQQAVKAALPDFPAAALLQDEIEARLSQGQCAVPFQALGVEWEQFKNLWHQADEIARRVRCDWADGTVPVSEPTVVQAWYEGDADAPDERHAFLITAALAPFLQRAAERVRPHIRQDLWRRGTCPVCGGRPDLAVLDQESGARHLLCSRCDTQWAFSRLECPFCDNRDAEQLAYYVGDQPGYRLYVCEVCRGYLKTLDLRERGGEVVPTIERVVTVGMDLAAAQAGYLTGGG